MFEESAAPLTLTLKNLSGSLAAEWYQPLSGERIDAGTVGNGESKLTPPERWGKGAMVLHVGGRVTK